VFLPWLTIACLDGTFLSSSLTKVPDGAWFTITLAIILGSVFMLWRFGKEQQWFAEAEDRFPTSHFVRKFEGGVRLADRFDGTVLSKINGFGVFFDKAGETTPIVFSQFAIKLTAMPEVTVFFHLRPLETPSVPPSERHTVSRLAIPHCYRLVVRYGYNDEVVTPNLASVIYEQIRLYVLSEQSSKPPALLPDGSVDPKSSTTSSEPEVVSTSDEKPSATGVQARTPHPSPTDALTHLDRAFGYKVMYIIGKEQMKIKKSTGYLRRLLLVLFLWMKENTRTKMANLNVPTEKVIEVGFLKEI
jgi:KUP system potassium uptake protein